MSQIVSVTSLEDLEVYQKGSNKATYQDLYISSDISENKTRENKSNIQKTHESLVTATDPRHSKPSDCDLEALEKVTI